MKKPDTNDLFLGTGVAALVLLIGILVGKALDLLEFKLVAIGVTISIIIILGIVAIVWKVGDGIYKSEINKIHSKLREIAPSSKYDWLFTHEDMTEIEMKTIDKDIWVVSPDLSNDTGEPKDDVISLVKNNLKKGIKYTYFVPDNIQIESVLPHLHKTFENHNKQLNIIKIPDKVFRSLTTTHLAIYNPNMISGKYPQVYWELPLDNRGYGLGHWIRVANDRSLEIVGHLRLILNNYSN